MLKQEYNNGPIPLFWVQIDPGVISSTSGAKTKPIKTTMAIWESYRRNTQRTVVLNLMSCFREIIFTIT